MNHTTISRIKNTLQDYLRIQDVIKQERIKAKEICNSIKSRMELLEKYETSIIDDMLALEIDMIPLLDDKACLLEKRKTVVKKPRSVFTSEKTEAVKHVLSKNVPDTQKVPIIIDGIQQVLDGDKIKKELKPYYLRFGKLPKPKVEKDE
jgi:hypothetical protein